MSSKIYLAGPIAGVSYEVARYAWRSEFKELLDKDWSYSQFEKPRCFGPMRGKEYLSWTKEMPSGHIQLHDLAPEISKPHGVMGRDSWDVRTASLVVANCSFIEKPSVGTIMEIGMAHAYRVPIILIQNVDGDDSHWSKHAMMVEAATYRVATVDEAVALAVLLFHPGL